MYLPMLLLFGLLALSVARADEGAPGPAARTRVMSYNILIASANPAGDRAWPTRGPMVRRIIDRYSPDLIGLQEVQNIQLHDLMLWFGDTYTFFGGGKQDGLAAGTRNPLMYRRQRYEELKNGQFWLSETPDVPGSKSWDAAVVRMASWLLLKDRHQENRQLLVICTHWDHLGESARLQSAKMLVAFITQAQTSMHPDAVILIGDLNAGPQSEPIRTLLEPFAGLRDIYHEAMGDQAAGHVTFNGFGEVETSNRIDWIICNGPLRAISAHIDRSRPEGLYPSDHDALVADLAWDQ